MDTRTTDIGKRIAEIRQHRGMSQGSLARALHVSRYVVFHVEHAQTRITVELIERIATVLHCSIEDLLAPPDAPIPRARLRRRKRGAVESQGEPAGAS